MSVVDATLRHAVAVARRLDRQIVDRAKAAGVEPRREIVGFWRKSSKPRALVENGRCIGIGGVTGTAASSDGMIWLALAPDAKAHPRALVEHARCELARIMATRRRVTALVDAEDRRATRFAEFLGATLGETQQVGDVRLVEAVWER